MDFQQMTVAEIKSYLDHKEELNLEDLNLLKADARSGVAKLIISFSRKMAKRDSEKCRLQKMSAEEERLMKQGFTAIAGVDEAGRGPLAGPVIAAAAILKPGSIIDNLKDSKQLSARSREKIFEQIVLNACSYGIAGASSAEIDRLNIHVASMLAMKRALARLSRKPDYILVDGFPIRDCPFDQKAITGGDALCLSIAAASILAKVSRDKIMFELHQKYPGYGFDRNMGYGTAEHREAIQRQGPSPVHRRSFKLI